VELVDFTQLSYSQWSSEAVQWSGEVCVSYKFRAPKKISCHLNASGKKEDGNIFVEMVWVIRISVPVI
jgi:hypothetical protein